jgi:uroporphyrinogen-III synthase
MTSKQSPAAMDLIDKEWRKIPVIAISDSTAKTVSDMGGEILHVSGGYGDKLYDDIREKFANLKILYPRAEIIVSTFSKRLRDEGIDIDEKIVYNTTCNDDIELESIEDNAVLAFTSPSAITCFLKKFGFKDTHKVVAIGTTTQKRLPLHVKSELSEKTTMKSVVDLAKKIANY